MITLNTDYYVCAYCGSEHHSIRHCDSPEIRNIEQDAAAIYYSTFQESYILNLTEQETEELFVNTLTRRYLLKDIRVLAVTSAGAASAGITKRQYAIILYSLYKLAFNNIMNQSDYVNNYIRDLINEV